MSIWINKKRWVKTMKYSVLLEIELEAKDTDELSDKVTRITTRCNKILKTKIQPYGYYKFPVDPIQSTLI